MTLLKRKSALWHSRAILLLDWVSGPLKTGVAQFPREHIQPGADVHYLWEAWEIEGGWEVQLEGSSLFQLSPQCSCIYHNSGGTIFYKSLRLSAQRAALAENLG